MLPALPPSLYAPVLGVACLLSTALTAVGLRARDEIGADWFAATMALVTVWNVLALVGFLVATPAVQEVLEPLVTTLSICVPVVWFVFVVEYSGRGHLLTRRRTAALWTIPAAAVAAVLTFPVHDLYYTSFDVVSEGGLTYAQTSPGPLALLNAAYVYLLFALGLWIVVRMIWDHDHLFAGQAVWLLVGTLVPVGLGLFNVLGVVSDRVPLIPAGMALLGLAYGYGLYRHRFLDLSPATRRIGSSKAFDDLNEGVVIVDTDWNVVAINDSARRQFDCESESVLGRDVGAVNEELGMARPTDQALTLDVDGAVLEVVTSTVEDRRDRRAGYALVVRDVTDRRGRKQRLEVMNRVLRHNVRNDMAVVKGYANEIALVGDDRTTEMATAIDGTADDLLSLAEKARTIERTITADENRARTVDVQRMVERLVDEIATEHRSSQVGVDVPDALTVTTDAPTLELVLRNVVENAVTYGMDDAVEDAPTTIADGVGNTGSFDVVVRAHRTDAGVEITVSDDGPGVPTAELGVIERGTETALEHCSGLGLWLVRWGATRLGADLTFDTANGTTVTLVVPDDGE